MSRSPCRPVALTTQSPSRRVGRVSRFRRRPPVHVFRPCRRRRATGCRRQLRNCSTIRRCPCRRADLPLRPRLSAPTHRHLHLPQRVPLSRSQAGARPNCQRRVAVARMASATAVRQVDTRPKGHPGIPVGMATAMGVRRERTSTIRPATTPTASRKQVMASSDRIRCRPRSFLPRLRMEHFSGRAELPMASASGHHQPAEMDRQTCLQLHAAGPHWRACWSEMAYRHRSGALTTPQRRRGGRRSPKHMLLTLEVKSTRLSDPIFAPVVCGKRSSFHDSWTIQMSPGS